MQTQGEIMGTYETSSSLQLQNNISIEMNEPNYFSILMQLLKDDDKFMQDTIAFIESNEDKRLWRSFDEYLTKTDNQESVKKFKEKYGRNVKSLITDLNSNQELKDFIKTNFGEKIYTEISERLNRHQQYIYLACEFVYEKYLNNRQDEIDVRNSSKKIKQDFKKYKKNNTKSKEEIVENLKKISRKIYELKGLKKASNEGKIKLPKKIVEIVIPSRMNLEQLAISR